MSDTTKRLDLQFGSFACSVQGFDDPVQPVQQVLQALQNLLEETPALSDAGISFDAEAIDRLIGEVARRADIDERDVEIVPGLIIVHRRDDGVLRQDDEAAGYPDTDDDAFDDIRVDRADGGETRIGVVGEADSGSPVEAPGPDDAEPGYVNIFAPRRDSDGEVAARTGSGLFPTAADHRSDPVEDADEGDELELQGDPFTDRLGAPATPAADDSAGDSGKGSRKGGPAVDIFADSGDDAETGSGGSVFADPMTVTRKAKTEDDGGVINFFTSVGGAGRDVDDFSPDVTGNRINLFASAAPDEAPEQQDEESDRGEVLFGRTEDQPEIEEADEGYTAAGLAKAAGAETVSDLIVSAAAWMALIQGQTTFTRSDVIAVFEEMPGDHVKTLEARVKGFGKAVRNGQLVLVEEGVFGLSRPELERFQRLL